MMIGKLSVLLALILVVNSQFKDTTQFWKDQTGKNFTFEAYSGYEQIDWYFPANQSGMHYQLFSAQTGSAKTGSTTLPLLLWLQGGPGSSSMFGAYTEIGPILIKGGQPELNDYSWNLFSHILFIDSPLNVGFSYSNLDRNGDRQVNSTEDATNHLVNFLVNFYKRWPHLKQNPLYLTGESFAGHYLPNLAKKIISNDTNLKFNLQGVSIGDGWTDPLNQINFYDTYLWSVGVVSAKFSSVCQWYQTNSMLNMYREKYQEATNYFDFLTNNDTTPEVYMGNISIFNFRNYDGLDVSFAKVLANNKAELGVNESLEYITGNEKVYTAFGNDITKSYASDVTYILSKVRVLVYNGQNDVVVNTPGVLQYLNALNWHGATQWKRKQKTPWRIGGEVTGWAKVHENLWFVLVNSAGHMVPTDQPLASYVMMEHFIHNSHNWDL